MPKSHPQRLKDKARDLCLKGYSAPEIQEKLPAVALPTLRRWIRNGGWRAMREAQTAVEKEAIASFIALQPEIAHEPLNYQDRTELLNFGLRLLCEGAAAAPVRSREAACLAIARILEISTKLNPMSMDELAELAFNTPGFSVPAFVAALKSRLETQ